MVFMIMVEKTMLRKLIILVKHQQCSIFEWSFRGNKWLYDHGGKDDVTKANNTGQTPMYI